MGIVGQPTPSYHKKFMFHVEVDGLGTLDAVKCGPLEFTIGEVKQNRGGKLIPVKEAGKVEFANLTIEQAKTSSQSLFIWAKTTADAGANTGAASPLYKKNLDVVQEERDQTPLARYRVFGAFPTKFKAGEWDADAEENVIESIELAYDYYDQLPP